MPVIVAPLQEADFPGVLSVAREQLGDSFITESDLAASDLIAFSALSEQSIAGFCLGRVIPCDRFVHEHPSIARCLPDAVLDGVDRIGFLSSLAVRQADKGMGIGTRLARAFLESIDARGIRLTLLTGWKDTQGLHIGTIAHRLGFTDLQEITNYYNADSLRRGYTCPICGPPPCRCSAVVMLRVTAQPVALPRHPLKA